MANPFDTWSLDREIVLVKVLNHPRHKVFAAWMDPAALAQWYGPKDLAIENHEADIREGGIWRFDMVGLFEGKQRRFANLIRFLEIVPDERIVYTYWMTLGGPRISVSLSTIELRPEGKQTRLVYTEQGAFLDGLDKAAQREHGTRELLDKIATTL